MVVGALWSRHLDAIKLAGADPLHAAALDYHGWRTEDVPLASSDLTLLSPDMAMVRNYLGPRGNSLQFAVIAGHRKKSIHTPIFCMQGGGWEVISQADSYLKLGGVTVPVSQSILTQGGHSILMTYYFTDGAYRSSSVLPFQFVELLKRFKSTVTVGALVRVIVPVHTNTASAKAETIDFLSIAGPKVDAILRSAHMQVR